MGDDPPTTPLLERLTATQWDRLTRTLVGVAMRRGEPPTEAEETAYGVLTRACEAGSAARSQTDVESLTRLLCNQVVNLRITKRRRSQRQVTTADTEAVEEAAPSSKPDALKLMLERERSGRYLVRLRKALENSKLALRILDIYVDGVLTADELIAATGEKPDAVYHARRVILEAARKLLAEGSDPDIAPGSPA
jgi:DNA-directed RNA polymerase specialized sigma24 family protein